LLKTVLLENREPLPHRSLFQELIRELEIVTGQPPTELHHYTDAAGFHGIVKSGALCATDAFSLKDDAEEIKYGISMFSTVIEEMRSSKATHHPRDIELFEAVKD
jgi:hypothetical protein